jgi:hypothetical protein
MIGWLLDVFVHRGLLARWSARCVCGGEIRVRASSPAPVERMRALWNARHEDCEEHAI